MAKRIDQLTPFQLEQRRLSERLRKRRSRGKPESSVSIVDTMSELSRIDGYVASICDRIKLENLEQTALKLLSIAKTMREIRSIISKSDL